MTDDDEDWGPGCIGQGAIHDLAPAWRFKKQPKRPIGFVIFPDTQTKPKKARRPAAKKAKRRKR